ncbi:IS110 family transposase [Streptomyces sp. RB17]|uniref:IS110 family transposase n=1 Tax=Streptomyces sp. RB17 TaxID=2585197 RepID=UPI001E31C0E7|nr:IS110 family transposase [Streptomyces sp. RB17]
MTGTASADLPDELVVSGVDSHSSTLHVAVVTDRGGHLDDAEFPTKAAGYAAAIGFLQAHGTVTAVGVEGTSSYGAGFTRAARQAGLTVVEVNRPDTAERRRIGKSDPIDAYAAARAVVSGRATSAPKDSAVDGIRALQTAARSAVKARTAALNQITHLLVTAPDPIRIKYPAQPGDKRIAAPAQIRPATDHENTALLTALRTLARRVQSLTEEHTALTAELDKLVTGLGPGLRAAYGVGTDTAAQLLITAGANPERLRTQASFAALCGAAPVPASSGKTNRHRLSRGGDRAANAALYRIALTRDGPRPTHTRVRRPADRRRSHQDRDHPAAQARHRPRGLPAADHPRPGAPCRGPAADPAIEEHHPHHRGEPLRGLARCHLQHRARPAPR